MATKADVSAEKVENLLTRNVEDVFVAADLKKDLLSGRPLRVKLGFDPTGPKVHIGRAITLWKNYLSTLEDNNISSLTTREIVAHYHNDADVGLALRLADRVIYGNQEAENESETDLAFVLLRTFAERQFQKVYAADR